MLLSLICLVVILLLAAYLATQGALSSILALASALFGGLVALGCYELFAPLLDAFRPEYSRGVLFLGIFFLSFSFVRILLDLIIKRNVVLPSWIDRIGGGVVGFFTASLVVGLTVTGIEMLPLPERILGADYVSNDGPTGRVWPARLATGVFYLTSGRGFGGAPLINVHPDLGAEQTGYRHTVEPGSLQAMPADLLEVQNVFGLPQDEVKKLNVTVEGGKQLTVIRTAITKGTDQPKISCDPDDGALRLSTTQVRLVAARDDGTSEQLYPVGYLENGTVFRAMPLDTGSTIDDYNKAGKAVHDWIFAMDEGFHPRWIEIKRGGRQPVAVEDMGKLKAYTALASTEYPPHDIYKAGSIAVIATPVDGEPADSVKDLPVFVVRAGVQHRVVASALDDAYNKLGDKISAMQEGKGGWGMGVPGVPTQADFEMARRSALEPKNSSPETPLRWYTLVPVLLRAQEQPKLTESMAQVPRYWERTIVPLLQEPSVLRKSDMTGADGKVPPRQYGEGSYTVIIVQKPEKTGGNAFRVWIKDLELKKGEAKIVDNKRSPEFVIKK